MGWLKISFIAERDLTVLERKLEDSGAVAISFFDALDQPILEPAPGETPLWQTAKIEALFDEDVKITTIADTLWRVNAKLELFYEKVAEQNWQNNWQEHFEIKHFKRFSVYPEGNAIENDTLPVYIVPGLAFGTGKHETTTLCLGWLDETDVREKDVVDFGCGSGILAIAAQKLGAKHIWAIDHDPQALTSTQNNAALNFIPQNKIRICLPKDIPDNLKTDIILANILANPLMELAPTFAKMLRAEGKFVISGILTTQLEQVKSVYAKYFTHIDTKTLDDWACLWGTKS